MIRFGLCCIFREEPIKFRRATAKYISKFEKREQLGLLSEICLANANSLMKALAYCHDHGIGDFRINSQILPLITHAGVGYEMEELPDGDEIIEKFTDCGRYCREKNIRTTFHPDQFIVLSSPDMDVVRRSIADLKYQAMVGRWVGADVINLHAGGVYGDKPSALKRLCEQIDRLSGEVRARLTLENDDRSYTPEDLLPVCREMNIPLVYDVHHHRCLGDNLTVEEATECAMETWDREPLFHVSSPISGWGEKDIRKHHDFIDCNDFPENWISLDITVEVEAKAKELAVLDLMEKVKKNQKNINE